MVISLADGKGWESMRCFRKIVALSAAAALALCGCSNDGEPSSGADASALSEPDESSVVITADDLSKLGDRLKPIAELFSKKHYTMECTLTGSYISDPIKIKRIVNGDDVYQLQTEKLGSHGCVTFDGVHYDFDYVCGMYRETKNAPELSIIEQIAANGLPVSKVRRSSADAEYDTEEYIYTGETYITKMEFFFEKSDGRLVKYVTTYSVEGDDDIVETRTIDKLEGKIDDKVFNAYFVDELADFEGMSEEQRVGFCKGLCGSWNITADEMSEMGVNASNLKNIDYNTLFRLIYTYGNPHEQREDSSAAGESGNAPAEDSSADAGNSPLGEADSSEKTEETSSAAEESSIGE